MGNFKPDLGEIPSFRLDLVLEAVLGLQNDLELLFVDELFFNLEEDVGCFNFVFGFLTLVLPS